MDARALRRIIAERRWADLPCARRVAEEIRRVCAEADAAGERIHYASHRSRVDKKLRPLVKYLAARDDVLARIERRPTLTLLWGDATSDPGDRDRIIEAQDTWALLGLSPSGAVLAAVNIWVDRPEGYADLMRRGLAERGVQILASAERILDVAPSPRSSEPAPMRWLLNSAVLTAPGEYRYRLIDADAARRWAAAGPYESTIGYAETAAALGQILGADIAVNRVSITMAAGDEALVFRLVLPAGSARIDPRDKGRLGDLIAAGNYEIGILTRLA